MLVTLGHLRWGISKIYSTGFSLLEKITDLLGFRFIGSGNPYTSSKYPGIEFSTGWLYGACDDCEFKERIKIYLDEFQIKNIPRVREKYRIKNIELLALFHDVLYTGSKYFVPNKMYVSKGERIHDTLILKGCIKALSYFEFNLDSIFCSIIALTIIGIFTVKIMIHNICEFFGYDYTLQLDVTINYQTHNLNKKMLSFYLSDTVNEHLDRVIIDLKKHKNLFFPGFVDFCIREVRIAQNREKKLRSCI